MQTAAIIAIGTLLEDPAESVEIVAKWKIGMSTKKRFMMVDC